MARWDKCKLAVGATPYTPYPSPRSKHSLRLLYLRPSLRRPNVNPENLYLDLTTQARPPLDVYGSGLHRYHHVRHPSPEGLAEKECECPIVIIAGDSMLTICRMRLLELGDRIGYVSTDLKEDEIRRCIRKVRISYLTGLAHILYAKADKKYSICQEEYEEEDDLGKSYGHKYHLPRIKQWLSSQKNTCAVHKSDAVARS